MSKVRPGIGRTRAQRGVGIVEILVAVLVLSVGLLGLAGLQMRTLRNSESSMERGIAVVETHAVADAMRADRVRALTGAFNIALNAAPPAGATFPEVVIAGWRQNIRNSLGDDATGAVACNGALCTITIQWNDSRASGGVDTFSLTTEVQL